MSKKQAKLTNKVANIVALFESKNDKNFDNISKSHSVNKIITPIRSVRDSCINYTSATKFGSNDKENSSYCPLFNSKLRPSRTTSFIQNSNKQEMSLNKVQIDSKNSHIEEKSPYCPLYNSKLRPSRTTSFIGNSTNNHNLSLNKLHVETTNNLIKSKALKYVDSSSSCETTPSITPRSSNEETSRLEKHSSHQDFMQNRSGPIKICNSFNIIQSNEQPVRNFIKNSQNNSKQTLIDNNNNNFEENISNQTHKSPVPVKRSNRSNSNVPSLSSIKEALIKWCTQIIKDYNMEINNFSSDWADGLAFCALINHFIPNQFDFNSLSKENRRQNFELAFSTAYSNAGIARLLDVEDMIIMGNSPDWKCVLIYVHSIYTRFKDSKQLIQI